MTDESKSFRERWTAADAAGDGAAIDALAREIVKRATDAPTVDPVTAAVHKAISANMSLGDDAILAAVRDVPNVAAFLETAPEPKRLAPLPFGAPVPAPVLWQATGDRAAAVLSVGEVAILSGEGSAGKSTVTLQIARAAATAPADGYGEACGLRVRPGPVAFVSYEDSGARIAHRLSALPGPDLNPARIPHWPDPGPLYVGFEGGREQGQGPGPDWQALWAAVRAMAPAPSMVVIDPASAALADVSMNESGPVRAFMGALAREATAARCGVLVVAHSTKADRETDEPGPGAVAGSATWFDAARGVLRLSWKATKQEDRETNRRRVLRCIKANYGRSGWFVTLCEQSGRGGFGGFDVAPGGAPDATSDPDTDTDWSTRR